MGWKHLNVIITRLLLAPTSLFVVASKPSRWHVFPEMSLALSAAARSVVSMRTAIR
jgi:hypothetical protein